MTSPPDEIRKELARLAGRSQTRQAKFSRQAPCDWRPQQVIDPRSGEPFTPEGAWEFIVEQIEGGAEIDVLLLEKPPGKKGYVLKLQGAEGEPTIYVKLQIMSGYVLARSFHYSRR